jgi:hypothetical protein
MTTPTEPTVCGMEFDGAPERAPDRSRWCPICQGAKRPGDPICQACSLTRRERRS